MPGVDVRHGRGARGRVSEDGDVAGGGAVAARHGDAAVSRHQRHLALRHVDRGLASCHVPHVSRVAELGRPPAQQRELQEVRNTDSWPDMLAMF